MVPRPLKWCSWARICCELDLRWFPIHDYERVPRNSFPNSIWERVVRIRERVVDPIEPSEDSAVEYSEISLFLRPLFYSIFGRLRLAFHIQDSEAKLCEDLLRSDTLSSRTVSFDPDASGKMTVEVAFGTASETRGI